MPEGPSIVIVKEVMEPYRGCLIEGVSGNAKIEMAMLNGQVIRDFKSWGKHFLICLDQITIKIHFLMFGSYLVNSRKDREPRLSLILKNAEINFYTCSVKLIPANLDEQYDWSADVMSPSWSSRKALKKLNLSPGILVCDALLDQGIFSGVGNIIKNEVLFILKIHPESKIGKIPPARLRAVVKEARDYSFKFLHWKKAFVLRKHWLAYNKKTCPRCELPFIKSHVGIFQRRTFYCASCQKLYR